MTSVSVPPSAQAKGYTSNASSAGDPSNAGLDTLQSSANAGSAQARAPAVQVTLSAQAKAAPSPLANVLANQYAQFFPTRDGKPATALSLAVTDPGAVSSSAGKTLAKVASDARARLDAKYAEFNASGSPFDFNSWEGKDWYTLVGDLDRRSLYAVSSNQGGQFTDQEQQIAQNVLGQEVNLSSGYYSGPTSQAGAYVPPNGLTSASIDPLNPQAGAARLKAIVHYLDGVSGDEKNSIAWAYGRASAQLSFETITGNQDKDNLDSQDPAARLIADALKSIKGDLQRGTTYGSIRTADDLKRQPWFQGFEGKLDALLAQPKSTSRSAIDVFA